MEQEEFDKQLKEKAREIAAAAVKNFLNQKRRKTEWDEVSQLKLNRVEAKVYSQLSLLDSAKITIMKVCSRNMASLTKF